MRWRGQTPLVEILRDPGSRGQGVRVGLIDTRIQWDLLKERHPDACWVGGNSNSSQDERKAPTHGTLMADILLRQAPAIHVESHDVFDGRPTAEPEALVSALSAIRQNGHCRLVNLSLGIPEDRWDTPRCKLARQGLAREVLACYRAGIVVVASAHNAHPVLQSAPADNPPPLVSVAKAIFEDPFYLEYRPGDTAEFRARGLGYWGVTTASPSSSCATAHVSGLVCRLLALEPNLGPFQVKALLGWYAERLQQG